MKGGTIMDNTALTDFFAAANGFGGFRSYFGEIFKRNDFTRVFILKGGPGTGKSTLMKRIRDTFKEKGCVQSVRCSSDPDSLDGTIIKNGKSSVAIIDGTSPHEEDTRFPGAIDEIVNLGEAWNESALVKHRNEIVELCEKKKKHYATAYDLLELAGVAFWKEHSLTEEAYVGSDESTVYNEIPINKDKISGRSSTVALISAFSSRGYFRLKANASETVAVTGCFGSEYLFLSHFAKAMSLSGSEHTVLHSPFSEDLIEGVYVHASDTLYLANAESERIINTCRFLDDTVLKKNGALYTRFEECKTEMLNAAMNELKKASEAHFALESIYTKAVDFDTVSRIADSLLNEINYIFNETKY